MAARLGSKRLVVHTAVGKELAWRLHADLLELPYRSGERVTARDALAETILSDPRVVAALTPALEAIGARGDDPALRRRLEAAMAEYTRTRGAATEIATALLSLGTGAARARKITPGAWSLGPTLAAAIARRAAVMSFPMGGALGSVWYGLFPVAPSAVLVAGLTGGLLAASTVASAFAGVVADPMQRRLGLHEWRLRRMVDALERQMHDPTAPGSWCMTTTSPGCSTCSTWPARWCGSSGIRTGRPAADAKTPGSSRPGRLRNGSPGGDGVSVMDRQAAMASP